MFVVDSCDFRKVLTKSDKMSILRANWRPKQPTFPVFSPCISKHLNGAWCIRDTSRLFHHQSTCSRRVGSVIEVRRQASWVQPLESNDLYNLQSTAPWLTIVRAMFRPVLLAEQLFTL